MIKFNEEFYDVINQRETYLYRKPDYGALTAGTRESYEKFLDFVNTAKFAGIEYKPRRTPNPYYFIPDYKNRALSVQVTLLFNYNGKTHHMRLDSRYGGLENLVDGIFNLTCGKDYGKSYGSPEYVFRSYMIHNSYKKEHEGLELIYWPQYSQIISTTEEQERIKAILDKFAQKNNRISKKHEADLVKADAIISFERYIEEYKQVMVLMNNIRLSGISKPEMEKMFRLSFKYHHEADFFNSEQVEELVNLKKVQNVHNK